MSNIQSDPIKTMLKVLIAHSELDYVGVEMTVIVRCMGTFNNHSSTIEIHGCPNKSYPPLDKI